MKAHAIKKCCLCPNGVPPCEIRGKEREDWKCALDGHIIKNAGAISDKCKLPEWTDGC